MIAPKSPHEERRRIRRYPAVELQTHYRAKKGILGESWMEVHASDFSRKGVSVDVDKRMEVGSSITLSFDLKMEIGSISLEKVSGTVRHVKSLGGQMRCGVEFDVRQGTDLDAQLTRMESLLARSLNTAQRIRNQT